VAGQGLVLVTGRWYKEKVMEKDILDILLSGHKNCLNAVKSLMDEDDVNIVDKVSLNLNLNKNQLLIEQTKQLTRIADSLEKIADGFPKTRCCYNCKHYNVCHAKNIAKFDRTNDCPSYNPKEPTNETD
jgi:hypothetical protein